MWDHFTENAKQVVASACERAMLSGTGGVRSEHLLFSMSDQPDSVASRVLTNLGIDTATLTRDMPQDADVHSPIALPGGATFSLRAIRVLEMAVTESQGMSHSHVGTEHLLLAMMVDSTEAEGGGILSSYPGVGETDKTAEESPPEVRLKEKITYEAVRAEIQRLLGESNGNRS